MSEGIDSEASVGLTVMSSIAEVVFMRIWKLTYSFFAAEIERADLAVATMLSPRGLLKAPILVGIVRAR